MVIDKEDMEIMRTGLMKFFVKNARSSLDLAGSLKLVITIMMATKYFYEFDLRLFLCILQHQTMRNITEINKRINF